MSATQAAPPEESHNSTDSHNYTAEADSTVGVQGVVHGDVHVYKIGPGDPPDKLLAVAKRFLHALIPRPAEGILEGLFGSPFHTSEVAYYWMLAILSGKSLNDLNPQEGENLRKAAKLATQGTWDPWSQAAEVVKRMCRCQSSQLDHSTRSQELISVLDDLRLLPQDRQDEIQRHLDALLTGAIRQHVENEFAERIRERRLDNDRRSRVSKFFEPVPHEPLDPTPPLPRLTVLQAVGCTVAVCLGVAGPFTAERMALRHSPVVTLAVMALALAGLSLVVRHAPARFPKHFFPWTHTPSRATSRAMEAAVRRVFEQVRQDKKTKESTKGWATATRLVQTALCKEFACIYSDPKIQPNTIEYLIRPHAEEAWQRWQAGELPPARNPAARKFACGTAAITAAVLVTMTDLIRTYPAHAMPPMLLTALGCLLLPACKGEVFLVRLLHRTTERTMAANRRREQQRLYHNQVEELKDRPGDAEMARWLDDDKHFLRTLTMKMNEMQSHDVIAEAVLTMPQLGCRRARVPAGPWRHSKYEVWLYLLTDAGVRLSKAKLDFATGKLTDNSRTVFRYDAISSASIIEVGTQLTDHDTPRPQQQPEPTPKHGTKPDKEHETKASLALEVALIGGNSHVALVSLQLSRQYGDPSEDPALLRQLALDDTGLGSALRVLEQAAAEGREWITRARHRTTPIFED